jgi:hypothetical protein
MSPENRQALLSVAADLRKIIRWGKSNEAHLAALAQTITDVVREEKNDDKTVQKNKA